MTPFLGSRKPDFRVGRHALTYDDYWKRRGHTINKKLREREIIIRNLVKPHETILIMKDFFPNLFGHQIVYDCSVVEQKTKF